MELASFDEANTVLGKPADMTHDQCEAASVCRTINEDGVAVVVSCWKVTKEELEEIQRTGRVWMIVAGHTMAPVSLTGISPFGK